MSSAQPRGPVDSSRIPRYAGPATFARLPLQLPLIRIALRAAGRA